MDKRETCRSFGGAQASIATAQMSQTRWRRFSHVHLFRFFPGVPKTAATVRSSLRARFGVAATDDCVRFLFRFVDGRVSRSFGEDGAAARRAACRRRPTTGIGRRAGSAMGDVD